MISNSKQNWTVGSNVKVGFNTLTVRAVIQTPGDCKPDAYILTNLGNTSLYKFVPHNGLTSIDHEEADAMLKAQQRLEAANVAASWEISRTRTKINSLFGV